MIVSIIVAVSENNVIGFNNDLIWSLPDDMKFFTKKTTGHHVLMGRKNYDSIPEKYKPLPNRVNIVVTRREMESSGNLQVVNDIDKGIEIARKNGETELFIIGGGEIYKQTLSKVDKIYLTRIHGEFEGDTFFPELDMDLWNEYSGEKHSIDERHKSAFTFMEYTKK